MLKFFSWLMATCPIGENLGGNLLLAAVAGIMILF